MCYYIFISRLGQSVVDVKANNATCKTVHSAFYIQFNVSRCFLFERCPQQAISLPLKISFYFSLILLFLAGVIGLPSGEKPSCIKKLNDVVLLPLWVTTKMQQLYLFFNADQLIYDTVVFCFDLGTRFWSKQKINSIFLDMQIFSK